MSPGLQESCFGARFEAAISGRNRRTFRAPFKKTHFARPLKRQPVGITWPSLSLVRRCQTFSRNGSHGGVPGRLPTAKSLIYRPWAFRPKPAQSRPQKAGPGTGSIIEQPKVSTGYRPRVDRCIAKTGLGAGEATTCKKTHFQRCKTMAGSTDGKAQEFKNMVSGIV